MSSGFILLLLMSGHPNKKTLLAWLAYLFFISVVEEFAFRLILPTLLSGLVGMVPAVLISNLLFACIHYVTLRWKFINCAFVFIAGLGLSRLLTNTEDIAVVTLTHFFFTFINTPTPPKQRE
jgi:membrane protease YdiL (CAAX protease family)